MGPKQGKVWGQTQEILTLPGVEIHVIDFQRGCKCSKHMHLHRYNAFYCLSGSLLVRVWQKDYDLVDQTILRPREMTIVKPGLFHEFVGVEEGSAMEIYWTDGPSSKDIVREDTGGEVGNIG